MSAHLVITLASCSVTHSVSTNLLGNLNLTLGNKWPVYMAAAVVCWVLEELTVLAHLANASEFRFTLLTCACYPAPDPTLSWRLAGGTLSELSDIAVTGHQLAHLAIDVPSRYTPSYSALALNIGNT
eukprot:GHUV01056634.1.p1 GENE.GHUV01056634.1~~GHUV01056634.1.p1  ORF type:complete len:127 (+),score=17.28 GHUV01056634.1:458-838(+)